MTSSLTPIPPFDSHYQEVLSCFDSYKETSSSILRDAASQGELVRFGYRFSVNAYWYFTNVPYQYPQLKEMIDTAQRIEIMAASHIKTTQEQILFLKEKVEAMRDILTKDRELQTPSNLSQLGHATTLYLKSVSYQESLSERVQILKLEKETLTHYLGDIQAVTPKDPTEEDFFTEKGSLFIPPPSIGSGDLATKCTHFEVWLQSIFPSMMYAIRTLGSSLEHAIRLQKLASLTENYSCPLFKLSGCRETTLKEIQEERLSLKSIIPQLQELVCNLDKGCEEVSSLRKQILKTPSLKEKDLRSIDFFAASLYGGQNYFNNTGHLLSRTKIGSLESVLN